MGITSCCNVQGEEKNNIDLDYQADTPEIAEDIVAGQKIDLSLKGEESMVSAVNGLGLL